MRDWYFLLFVSSPVTFPDGSIAALFTPLASTVCLQWVYVSEVLDVFELGRKSNTSVSRRPTTHTVYIQRGAGLRGGGLGGSFESPDFAGLERCTNRDGKVIVAPA